MPDDPLLDEFVSDNPSDLQLCITNAFGDVVDLTEEDQIDRLKNELTQTLQDRINALTEN